MQVWPKYEPKIHQLVDVQWFALFLKTTENNIETFQGPQAKPSNVNIITFFNQKLWQGGGGGEERGEGVAKKYSVAKIMAKTVVNIK